MSCNEFRSSLDDLLDGELEAAAELQVRDHLAGCPACRVELEGAERLRRQLGVLPREVAPPRDLWPGVAVRLEPARPAPGSGWAAWLGAAAAVAFVGAVLTGMLAQPRHPGDPGGGPPGVALVAVEPGTGELERARAALRQAFEQRRGTLSDETLRTMLEALDVVERSVAVVSRALEQHPGDPNLAGRLVTAYRQEIDLLRHALRLPDEA